ncbi:hypothetical protein QQF45_17560 [Halopseudomonas aestusnigri]|uniref:hypothetical protein n=1 Tax=Halopseudomonas aestusnigri TaxID=857252 RepID=UPI00255348C5|nr:hypothetical protein [Halopseudomonas aestusnigri]MDL2200852.1 hypothetical protein [Halopseudomonas aestusnigri]
MFWRPVKLTREQGMRVIELRKAFLKAGKKRDLNDLIIAGREELRQLVDCGAISHREHDDLEMEYSRLFSARLLQFVPLNQPIKTAPAANEPVAAEPVPRRRITWRTAALVAGSLSLGLVAGIYIEEWLGALLTVACLVLGGDQ